MSEWPLTAGASRLYRARLRLQITRELRASLIRQMRAAAISSEEIGRRLGRGPDYVGNILEGCTPMTISRLADLCAAMEVEPRLVLTPWAEIEKEPPK